MRNFNQRLSEAFSFGDQQQTHTERNKRARTEKALRQADDKCRALSGMGERYFYAAIKRMRILQKVSEYRELNDWEQSNIEQGEKIIKKYYPQSAKLYGLTESNESRLIASVLQKLDASPEQMPYNSIWTGIDVVTRRFGLTPEEARALVSSKAYKKAKNGYEIDRTTLKLMATRPDVPVSKKNLQRTEVDSTFDRNRKETGNYFGQ